MNRVLRCADTGLHCDYVICGQTRDEVLNTAGDHIQNFHREKFSKSLYEKVQNAIHEADCEQEIRTGRILLF